MAPVGAHHSGSSPLDESNNANNEACNIFIIRFIVYYSHFKQIESLQMNLLFMPQF